MRWYYACKVQKGTVFIKRIYTSGNSREAELVRPKIQKKIADTCIDEMILCMWSTQRYCIYQRNLCFRELTHGRTGSLEHPKENSRYMHRWNDIMNLCFRELTHGRTGSLEHPKENSRYMHRWNDIMHGKYAKVLYLSKESIFQRTHARPGWFVRRSKRE